MWLLFRKLKSSIYGMLGFFIVFAFVLMAIIGPHISPHDPETMSLGNRLARPVWLEGGRWQYPFGTDMLGYSKSFNMWCTNHYRSGVIIFFYRFDYRGFSRFAVRLFRR